MTPARTPLALLLALLGELLVHHLESGAVLVALEGGPRAVETVERFLQQVVGGGQLRIIGPAESCRPNETPLSWNIPGTGVIVGSSRAAVSGGTR